MAKEPGKGIPKLFDSWDEVKAAYSFFAPCGAAKLF